MENLGIENEMIVLLKGTIDRFLEEDNTCDLISLYVFYYYTAKWQKTNQPKATDNYVMNGLKMGKVKFSKAKKTLQELGLIEQVTSRSASGRVTGHYIKLKYIMSKSHFQENHQNPQNPPSGFQETNALSTNRLNALSTNITEPTKTTSFEDKNKVTTINAIFSEFAKINSGINGMRSWKHEREAAWNLVMCYPLEQVVAYIRAIPELEKNTEDPKYFPNLKTPSKLLEKWTYVEKMLKLSKSNKNSYFKI